MNYVLIILGGALIGNAIMNLFAFGARAAYILMGSLGFALAILALSEVLP